MTNATKSEFSEAIKLLMFGLRKYQAAHAAAYGSDLADDYVLGEEWVTMARALLGLLNGERGSLDGGTVDSEIRDIAELAGFDRNLE